MKPEETIFDGISDSEMESISGGIAEVQSESQSESAAGDGYAVKCCNNKLKTKDEEKVKAGNRIASHDPIPGGYSLPRGCCGLWRL